MSTTHELVSITDVTFQLPTWEETLRVLSLQAGFNSAVVVLGTTFLGLTAGIVGTFAMLRKRSLLGDALAHSSLPGLCGAFLLMVYLGGQAKHLPTLLFGATISGIIGIMLIQLLYRKTRLTEDAAIGAVLSVFFGLGVVLLSVIQSLGTGGEGGLNHFIYGQTAAMMSADAWLMISTAVLAILISTALFKEFRLVCFDEEFAAVQGWPITIIDFAMMSLIVIVTVVGLQAVGMILVVALLIVPASTARFWTERLNTMLILSGLFGALSGYFGAATSALFPRMPAGAVIVLVAGILFTVSFFFAPSRGLIAGAYRLLAVRIKVVQDHLLRDMYERLEQRRFEPGEVALGELRLFRSSSPILRALLTFPLMTKGLVRKRIVGSTIALTDKGAREASRLTRNHRLWEEYLVIYGNLATTHVDYSADLVEHALSPDIVMELETALRRKGLLPEDLSQPHSLHPTGAFS